jgi:hypothetical protein
MSRRPSARALKRSLLAAVCVLAIASATIQPTHTTKHADAAVRTVPATIFPQPGAPRSIPPAQPRDVATTVARAYARYLAGQLPAQQLPALTPQALASARHSGPLPARLHVTRLPLTSVTGAAGSWTAHFTIIDARGRQTATSQLLLSATGGQWKVIELVPPDPDTLITPNPPALPTADPAAARRAALGFTQSYLDYTYGHAAARQLRDPTPEPRAAITSNPPSVPATIRALHPRIASLALRLHRARWLVNANVTDGQDTYQVISLARRIHGEWLVIALNSAE